MKCKECKKESATKVEEATISIRYPNKAVEVVADNICMECLLKALKSGK